MKDVKILDYAPSRREAFERLNREWLERYFVVEAEDEKIFADPEGKILENGGRILFAESAGEIVGTCALLPAGPRSFELAKMAVSSKHQGQGIGGVMLAAAIREARELKAHTLVLLSNRALEPAVHLYRKHGFREIEIPASTHARYNRADIMMSLDLD